LTITLGFSPCPNDTFIFHALVHGLVQAKGIAFSPPRLADVETLNEWALAGVLDLTKISFHAFAHVRNDYVLLSAGSALGRGCGPLLVSGRNLELSRLSEMKIAVPGRLTTASMLLSMFAPACKKLLPMRFDRIMPAIVGGEVDAGVIIHESRFTYRHYGLTVLQDLGSWWEEISGFPIPLGAIAAKRSLGRELIGRINEAVRASVQHAFAHPGVSMPYIKKHAQEIEDEVISEHINLYVNAFTENLGDEGAAAVNAFWRKGCEAGILPASALRQEWLSAEL
jgi:1,4-dihydroxy-6-naphthoate synthase